MASAAGPTGIRTLIVTTHQLVTTHEREERQEGRPTPQYAWSRRKLTVLGGALAAVGTVAGASSAVASPARRPVKSGAAPPGPAPAPRTAHADRSAPDRHPHPALPEFRPAALRVHRPSGRPRRTRRPRAQNRRPQTGDPLLARPRTTIWSSPSATPTTPDRWSSREGPSRRTPCPNSPRPSRRTRRSTSSARPSGCGWPTCGTPWRSRAGRSGGMHPPFPPGRGTSLVFRKARFG